MNSINSESLLQSKSDRNQSKEFTNNVIEVKNEVSVSQTASNNFDNK